MIIKRLGVIVLQVIFIGLFFGACSHEDDKGETTKKTSETKEEVGMTVQLKSSAFEQGDTIPAKYTCKGEDISVPLKWKGSADGIESFVLIMDDPDAPVGIFDHWIVYNIPGDTESIPEGASIKGKMPEKSKEIKNSFGKKEYGGPCPPSGEHRYFFRIYALDTTLDLNKEASRKDLESEMEGHILERGELMGVFAK